MRKENVRLIINMAVVIVFALPCCLVFAGDLFLKFLGVVYGYGLWQNILKHAWKRYREIK